MLSYEFKERLCSNQLGARTFEDLGRMREWAIDKV